MEFLVTHFLMIFFTCITNLSPSILHFVLRTSYYLSYYCLILIAFLALSYSSNCSSGLGEGNKKWNLKTYKVQTKWNTKGKKVPFAVASLPKKVPSRFILPNLLPAGNQGQLASGTAWATGYFAVSYLQRQKKPSSYLCAPAFIYNSLNGGTDSGIEIIDALHFLKKRGCPPESDMPYHNQDPARPPSTRAKQNAINYRINGFARVDYIDIDQIRAHLLQKKPMVVTMVISKNFIKLDKLVWEQPIGASKGRHTMAIIGYDDSKELLYLLNSVGKDWGEKGQVAVSYAWFIRLSRQVYTLW